MPRHRVTLLRRLLCSRVQRASGRAGVRVRDHVPCRQPGALLAHARKVTASHSHTSFSQSRKGVVLAAADDVTRQRCMRIIQAASAGASSPLQDKASAVALTRDLAGMQNVSAVNAVLAALGRAAVKGLDVTSLKAAGFDTAACAAAGGSWADVKTAGFTAAEAKAAGCDAASAMAAGYDLSSLKTAGYGAAALNSVGYGFSALVTAGFSASELTEAGFSSEVKVSYAAAHCIIALNK